MTTAVIDVQEFIDTHPLSPVQQTSRLLFPRRGDRRVDTAIIGFLAPFSASGDSEVRQLSPLFAAGLLRRYGQCLCHRTGDRSVRPENMLVVSILAGAAALASSFSDLRHWLPGS
jgi:hypothetical protein